MQLNTLRKTVDLKATFARAVSNRLTHQDMEGLSVYTRCRLIHDVVEDLESSTQINAARITQDSLRRLGKSFPVSQSYYDWEDKKQEQFIDTLSQRKHRALVAVFKNWAKTSSSIQQEAVAESCELHRSAYMMGVAERLPLAHSFRNMTSKRIRGIGKTILYGTFHGDMERRKGYITQNINEDAGFNDPEMALDTAHHETTHSIHFGLALAYQDGIIRADHPLHDEAQYFHAIEKHSADIPTRLFDAYQAQTHEILAERQGNEISRNIMNLVQFL